MTTSGPVAPRGMRWMRIALAVSLALNLLVLGAAGGALTMRGKWHGEERRSTHSVGMLGRALDPADRRVIRQGMRAAHEQGELARVNHRAELEGLVADLRAVPFDPQPVAERLAQRRAEMDARYEVGQRLLLERIAAMTDAERAAFADRLAEADKARR